MGMECLMAWANVVVENGMVTAAEHEFAEQGGGQRAVIRSIGGAKGLGWAPGYAGTKRFQNTYIEALDQLAHINRLPIVFTDIRPGFVATPLLKDDKYPLLMNVSAVAAHIINALNKKKRTVIIDRRYQVLVFFWRLIPKWLWVKLPVKN